MSDPGAPKKPLKVDPSTPYLKMPAPNPATLYDESDWPMLINYLEGQGALNAPLPTPPTVTGPQQAIVSPPARVAPALRVAPPDMYLGDPEGLRPFLRGMDFYLSASGVSLGSPRSVSLAALRLGGSVSTWFSGVCDLADAGEVPVVGNFADFSRLLTGYVQPVVPYQRYYTDLYHIMQGKTQSTKDFIAHFNKTRARITTPFADEHLRYLFLGALKPSLQQQIVVHNPKTLAQCFELANTLTDLGNSIRPSPTTGTSSGSTSTSSPHGKARCTFCKKLGHTEDKCYVKNPELRPKSGKKDKNGKKMSFDPPAKA